MIGAVSAVNETDVIAQDQDLNDAISEDIADDEPLFGGGLGLDSIDALELGMAIKQKYGLTMSADNEEMKKHFFSVKTIADFVKANS